MAGDEATIHQHFIQQRWWQRTPRFAGESWIRWRTVTGICNDVLNPAMGSSGMLFARNVELDTSFPDLGLNELTRNRHAGNRLSLLEPDPQVISAAAFFTRVQSDPARCQEGYGLPG